MSGTYVFIDGKEGTTGLNIRTRLLKQSGIQLIELSEDRRKDAAARREALNSCQIAFLCLPDAAAKEAMQLIEAPAVRVIDASTAHRTAPGWVYGFPELSPAHQAAVAAARYVANPGCHASGFLALVQPLCAAGLLDAGALLSCFSLTGYSGGGKKMIAEYEAETRDPLLAAPRLYGLGQQHKHLPEMQQIAKLKEPPVFCPVVDDFYSGMLVTVPLSRQMLQKGAGIEAVKECFRTLYRGPVVRFVDTPDEAGFLSASALSNTDRMEIAVFGTDERMTLVSRFDNLGKGASGAAVENMNLMLGLDQTLGLTL